MLRRTLIVFLALILCAIIWWIGPLVAIGSWQPFAAVWIRVLLIVLIACWACWPFVALFIGWLIRQIRAPFSAPPKTLSRDRVTVRFYDAIRTLKYVGLSKQRTGWQRLRYRFSKRYLNDRPWFMILGPGNSGKTSLLSESGETFILAEQYGLKQTVDIGPTQDCNWWLTERAVFIDTAGDWTQLNGLNEETARAQSRLFKLLRRFRKHPVLDGIFLCLDGNEILHASLTHRKSLADSLRARLLEIAALARCDLPVYLMINHIDELAGGKTLLAFLSDELLHKGIGFTVAFDRHYQQDLVADEQRYQQMVSRVSRYTLELLHEISAPEQRKQLLFFIESLGALGKPLFNMIEQIFPATPVGYVTRLQQLWLGSTQPVPVQSTLFNHSDAEIYEGRSNGTLYQTAWDQAVAGRYLLQRISAALPWPERMRLLARYCLVVALLVGGSWALVSRYFWENDYISWIGAHFDETRRLVREVPLTNRVGDDLIAAYEQLGYMNVQVQQILSPPVNPYIEHDLINEATQKTYHRHLLKFFWPAVENYVASILARDAASTRDDVYNTLKVYIMLAKQEHREGDALVSWFMARWDQFAPAGYTDMNKAIFSYHLRQLFSLADTPAMKPDFNLVRIARVKAADIPMQQRVVRRIDEQNQSSNLPDITLASAAGSDVTLTLRRKGQATVSDVAVPKFYTRASYRDLFMPQVHRMAESVITEQAWVMQDDEAAGSIKTLASAQKLTDEARKLYLLEYANSWTSFMNDVRARPVNGLEDAAQLARQLGDPSSSLANLVRFATRETSLTGRDQSGATSWFDRQKTSLERQKRNIVDEISGERSRFRLLPEDAVEDRFQQLRRVGLELSNVRTGGSDPMTRVFDALFNQISAMATALRSGQMAPQYSGLQRSRMDAARQPEPIRSVMMDLIQLGSSESLQQSRQNLSKGAASIASGLCNGTVRQRYPFARNARSEVGIEDFARLFSRNGAMQTFFDQNLASLIDMNSHPWKVKEGGIVNAATVRSFENAALIRDTFFGGGDKPSFTMFIRPVSLSANIAEATLDIDGQQINYGHGSSQPVRIEWPGPKGGSYIRLTFKTLDGTMQTAMFEGPWAIFRMYDASSSTPLGADRREMVMAMAAVPGNFRLELRSTMKDFPLWSRALKNFSCPQAM